MPFLSGFRVESKQLDRLNFRVASGLDGIRGSTTTFYNPSMRILEIIDSIQKLVLPFNTDYTPLSECDEGAVFDGENYSALNSTLSGQIYIRGFYITNQFAQNLLFCYNLTGQEINPDRDNVDSRFVKYAVGSIIASCENPVVVDRIISKAVDNEEDLFEFQPIDLTEKIGLAELYRAIFYGKFGNKAVLYTDDPFMYAEAKHRGYRPVKLNRGVRATLQSAGVLTDSEVVEEGFKFDYVEYDELTAEEKAVLELHRQIDACLNVESSERPRVYSKAYAKNGEELPYPGFCGNGGIHVRRDQLQNIIYFVETYSHEKGHQVTGAGDPEDRFRKFFERNLVRYVVAELIDQRAGGDQSAEVARLKEELSATQNALSHLMSALKERGYCGLPSCE